MNNYQLYRTNVALGGQMKWDISVDNDITGLKVSDFHITPISRRVPYNRYAHDNLLNYSHLENLKTFYHNIEGAFYLPYADPILTTEQPYVYPEYDAKKDDLHVDTFDMGVHRAQYSIYGKQFEAFCPVWLEDMYDDKGRVKPLAFTFCMRYRDKRNVIQELSNKPLILDFSHTDTTDIHDRFVNYLGNYIHDIHLDDKLIKIGFKNMEGVITGVDVSTGLVKTTNISALTRDILAQERLLMETDYLILNRFATNHMIAKQLFNFNFVFDFEEFFPQQIINMMRGKQTIIDIRVKVGSYVEENGTTRVEFPEEYLEIKDFYTNYDNIKCERVGIIDSSSIRGAKRKTKTDPLSVCVFDDLLDTKNVDLTTQNKMVQTICHWSIANNNDYIFNVYDGFAGYIVRPKDDEQPQLGNKAVQLTRVYQNSPDIWTEPYNELTNNLGWVKCTSITSYQDYLDIDAVLDDWKANRASHLGTWVNNIRYNYIPKHSGFNPEYVVIVALKETDSHEAGICWSKLSHKLPSISDKVIVDIKDNMLMFFTYPGTDEGKNILTFAYFRNHINEKSLVFPEEFKDNKTVFKSVITELLKWMNSVDEPQVISFDKCLGYMRAEGPSKDATELDHYSYRQVKRLFRVDGYIKPTFVSPDKNLMYTKRVVNDFKNTVFSKYAPTGYAQHYPSIGYYPFQSKQITMTDLNSESQPIDPYGRTIEDPYIKKYEHRWFTYNKVLVVDSKMSFRVESKPGKTIKDLIIDYLIDYYKLTGDNGSIPITEARNKAYYIYDLYDMTYDWEYKSLTEIDKYIYTIKLVLK